MLAAAPATAAAAKQAGQGAEATEDPEVTIGFHVEVSGHSVVSRQYVRVIT